MLDCVTCTTLISCVLRLILLLESCLSNCIVHFDIDLDFCFFIIGKDPLPDRVDGKDINSVAGVLKLYFRELKEPLFRSQIFDDLMACSSQHNFNSQYIGCFSLD